MAEIRYISAERIGEMLDLNAEHVRNRLSRRPGFPTAYRFAGSLRWVQADVEKWMKAQAEDRTTTSKDSTWA